MHILFDRTNLDVFDTLSLKHYKKDAMIFNEGDECKTIGLVVRGSIRITTYTAYDKEYTILILYPNDLFGESLLFSCNPYYLGHIIALEDCSILFINRHQLMHLLQTNTVFLENFLHILAHKHLTAQNRIKLLLQKEIKEKILFYLSEQAKKMHTSCIPITTKENLAKLLNIPRPSLSRALINLKKENWIIYDNKHITLLKKM